MSNSTGGSTPGPGGFDPARFKEQERTGFNFVAGRYEQAMQHTGPVIERMLALAEFQPGMAVLDVATGPGLLARAVARRLGETGRVVGVDIAETSLEQARERAGQEGFHRLEFQVDDAENLSFAGNTFDRVLCSLGLMHFPQPHQALAGMWRVLKPGGRMVASVWGEAEQAPFIQAALSNLSRNFPPPKVERPSMFRFGPAAALEQLVGAAGFSQVASETVTVPISLPDAATYWRQFLDVAGITAIALARQTPELQAHLEKDIEVDLAPYRQPDGRYRLDSTLRVVVGVKP